MKEVIRVICSHQRKAPGQPRTEVGLFIRGGPARWSTMVNQAEQVPVDYPDDADSEWAYDQLRRGAPAYFRHPLRCEPCNVRGGARLETLAPLLDQLSAADFGEVELVRILGWLGRRNDPPA